MSFAANAVSLFLFQYTYSLIHFRFDFKHATTIYKRTYRTFKYASTINRYVSQESTQPLHIDMSHYCTHKYKHTHVAQLNKKPDVNRHIALINAWQM